MITSEIGEGEVEEALIRARLTTGVAVANVAGAVPPGGIGSAAGAFDTSVNRDTFIATVAEIKAQLNALLAGLRTSKSIAP